MNSISFVFPVYNEEENIGHVIDDALEVGRSLNIPFEIITVNDGSRDNTGKVIANSASLNREIKIINHEVNKGYGTTLRDGFEKAQYEWVFFSDSDRQFDISEIRKFIDKTKDFDLIVGYRINRKDSDLRKLNAFIFKIAVKIFFNINVKDVDCAFKLIKKEVLSSINLVSNGALINTELFHKSSNKKFRIVEIPVNHYPRIKGKATGANFFVIIRAVKEIISLRYNFIK